MRKLQIKFPGGDVFEVPTEVIAKRKSYEILDLEWRFWDRVCIKTDGRKSSGEFVPVEFFFDTLAEKRDKTIEEVLKK